jgi:hypothetical protein
MLHPLPAVTYVAFLSFVLLVAAIDADPWVVGALEFTIPTQVSLPPRVRSLCAEYGVPTSVPSEQLGDVTIVPEFQLGLLHYTVDGTTYARWSGASIEEFRQYKIADQVRPGPPPALANCWPSNPQPPHPANASPAPFSSTCRSPTSTPASR